MNFKSIQEAGELEGKKVLLRTDFNVPVVNGKVKDDFRIQKSLETIRYLISKKAKIILISHLGEEGTETFEGAVTLALNTYIPAAFVKDIVGDITKEAIAKMSVGDVLLLENLRQEKGEVENDPAFAGALSHLGDIYINDAFSVSHREHASVVGIPKHIPGFAGFQFMKEYQELSKVFSPKHPFVVLISGAKFSTKLPLIEKYLEHADHVFVGGALANTCLKEMGYEIGKSLIDTDVLLPESVIKSPKLIVPHDVLVIDENGKEEIKKIEEIAPGDLIVDASTSAVAGLAEILKDAKMILWNGPLGKGDHTLATKMLLNSIRTLAADKIIGGGDTVEVISEMDIPDGELGFVSTAGGAMLEFLAKETLPGIEALAIK